MKSALTKEEIETLLNSAEDAQPDSNFVASVREWFEDHGFITDGQESALNEIVDEA